MITSPKNRQVVKAARLKKRALRDKERRFLVEGAQVTAEALDGGRLEAVFHVPQPDRTDPIVTAAEAAGVPVQPVNDRVMAHLTSTVTPQGIAGVAGFVDAPLEAVPADAALVAVLCSVRDPGNAGTILRSADAAGADALVFSSASVDVYNPKTVRASAGSLFHLPVVRGPEPAEAVAALRERGMQVLAAAADGDRSIYEEDLARPTVVLFGNEAWGLEPEVRALADRSVRVPIHGKAESLNLAAAAALIMFESARQREGGGRGAPDGVAELVSAASHDIRSPLTALTGFASTLLNYWDRFEDAQRREMVRGIMVDGQRVTSLVRLVVDAARIAGGHLPAVAERHDAGETARWVGELFALSPDFPPVRAEGSGRVALDRDRMNGVLLAAVEGAMWWASEGPVEVRIRPSGEAIEIEVHRAGGGPSEEDRARMFAAPKSGGRVSLYAAARLVEAIGGEIACEGGDGVTFRLRLPAA